jgi:hypothetical protein
MSKTSKSPRPKYNTGPYTIILGVLILWVYLSSNRIVLRTYSDDSEDSDGDAEPEQVTTHPV